jgi:hypothetical protein
MPPAGWAGSHISEVNVRIRGQSQFKCNMMIIFIITSSFRVDLDIFRLFVCQKASSNQDVPPDCCCVTNAGEVESGMASALCQIEFT